MTRAKLVRLGETLCRRTLLGLLYTWQALTATVQARIMLSRFVFGHHNHPPVYTLHSLFPKNGSIFLYLGWRAVAKAKSGKPSKGSHAGPTQKINLTPENPKFFSWPLPHLRPVTLQPKTRTHQVEPFLTVLAIFTILAILAVLRHTA